LSKEKETEGKKKADGEEVVCRSVCAGEGVYRSVIEKGIKRRKAAMWTDIPNRNDPRAM